MSTNIYTDCYGIVYITTNLINNKKYIGQTSKDNPEYLGSGKLLKQAIKKYGSENFKRETLKICYSQDELNEQEVYFIALFNAVLSEEFYNIANGGQGGAIVPCTEETKKKISLANKGNIVWNKGKQLSKEIRKKISDSHKGKQHSEETKKKISLKFKGDRHPLYGKSFSEESKLKMSQSHKGKQHSEKSKLKMSLAKKGKTLSEETKLKMSQSKLGISKPQKQITCPHCGKTGGNILKRHHFDNCKFK